MQTAQQGVQITTSQFAIGLPFHGAGFGMAN
jgi:hypothetical protein